MKNQKKRTNKNAKPQNLKLTLLIVAAALLVAAIISVVLAIALRPASSDESTPPQKVEMEFLPVLETVYAYYDLDGDGYCDDNVKINLRDFPTTDSDIKLRLSGGTQMTRVGIYYEDDAEENGWSMVEYNGEKYYCRNSCLTKDDPAKSDRPPQNY